MIAGSLYCMSWTACLSALNNSVWSTTVACGLQDNQNNIMQSDAARWNCRPIKLRLRLSVRAHYFRGRRMLSLSPITRSVVQNLHSSNGEHEVPVTPELGSSAAVVARRRLSPASSAVVRRQRSASLTTVTNTAPTRQEPATEGLPSSLENYSMKLSKYRGGATPSPLLREALSGQFESCCTRAPSITVNK